MISYNDILLFATVAKVGSFVDAAKAIHVSHTTIARRIKSLEDELGAPLVNRSSHHFSLTPIGEKIYNVIATVADNHVEIVEAIEQIISKKKTPSGKLTIILSPILHKYVLVPYIVKFLRLYPDIKLNCIISTQEVNLIKDGADIAITYQIPKQLDQKYRKIFSQELGLYCTKQYAEKYGLPQSPLDLKHHLIIAATAEDSIRKSEYVFTNIFNGDIVKIKYGPQITTTNALHHVEYLFTNEVICPTTQIIIDSLSQKSEIIQILPEYSVFKMNFYLLTNPYGEIELINLFTKYLNNIFESLG
jgi:DNA-binding transcriptional LysR family regulator